MSVNGTAYRPFGEVKLIGDNEPGSAVETSRWAVGDSMHRDVRNH
jgi:hypothetical protein